MKKIMKSIKIAFTILVMSSLNFACHSSSQEAVAPINADVTTASAATEAKPTAEVAFWNTDLSATAPQWTVKSYGNENKKGDFGGRLEDKVRSVIVYHHMNSTKKNIYVKVFENDNQTGKVLMVLPAVPRGQARNFGFDLPGKQASSFSIYYSEN
jgi:hypothetical protein